MISQKIFYICQINMPLKNALIILFLIISTIASATDYYICSSGKDTNNGLSSSTPWKTIAKVNASSFSAGDTIFFNKGDIWRETLIIPSSGNAGAYIVFSSYGTGSAPKILGSIEVTAWTRDNGNVWYSNNIISDPYNMGTWTSPGNIYFKETDGDISWGRVKKTTKGDLASEYDWIWISNHIYIYSPTDPNKRYSGVEVSQIANCIILNNKDNLTFDGIEIAYSGSTGIGETWSQINTSGLIVRNCHIHHIGIKSSVGAYGLSVYHSNMLIQNNIIHDSGRRNISLNIYDRAIAVNNITIEGNTLYHGFHTTGVDISSGGVGTLNNILIRNNLIYDDVSETLDGVESYQSNGIYTENVGTGSVSNLYITNNVIINATSSALQLSGLSSSYVYNNTIYGVNPNLVVGNGIFLGTGNCVIKNNIIYSNAVAAINTGYRSIHVAETAGIVISDYNLFYCEDAAARPIAWRGLSYITANWFNYKLVSGQDSHSPNPANPAFVSSSDYRLQSGSPAIDAGVDVGLPYNGKAPDIGAFETQSESITPIPPVFSSAVVENVKPSILEMIYNITLANVAPAASAFSVRVNSVTRNVNTVAISGTRVLLTLASPIVYGDVITVTYTKPTSNPMQATSTGTAVSISNQPVVNNCINGTTTVNQPPVVEILNPLKGNTYETNSSITLEAMASDPDGSISKVEFFNGAIKLIELTSAPYTYTWKDVAAGSYSITAVATDNLNATTTSSPIEFEVASNSKYDANSEILNLYPNPNDGHFSIEFVNPMQNERSEIIITDLAGKQVYNGLLLKEETIKQIDISYIKSGIYLLLIFYKEILVTKKIIKY
jgi:uncharacterized repeat protein (TIGR02059 family)